MNCQETDTLLSLAEALGDQADRKIAHVAQCATCRSTLADLSVLRLALAAEELSAPVLERAALAIEPLGNARKLEKRKLALLFVVQFLVVSFTLAVSMAMISGPGMNGFGPLRSLIALPGAMPLAFLVGLIFAWRTYRSERTRLRALEIR
jgi:hypothetical protein